MPTTNQHSRTDAELLEQIQHQDATALKELYQRYSHKLLTLIHALVHDSNDSEDLLQEVFIRIWKNAATYNSTLGSPCGWMMQIARNRAIDLLRSRQFKARSREVVNSRVLFDMESFVSDLYTNDTWMTTLHSDRAIYVDQALLSLPNDSRALIELSFFQGYSHREIATLQKLPLGTVKTRIRNGIQSLRRQLSFLLQDFQVT